MSEILSGIYKIYCENTKKYYIGQSVNVINRLKQHLKELKNNKHINKELQTDFNNYGEDAFIFEKIKDVEEEFLNIFEKYYMEYYNSLEDGYNVIPMNNLIKDKYKNKTQNDIEMLRNIEPIEVPLRAGDLLINQLFDLLSEFEGHDIEYYDTSIGESMQEKLKSINEFTYEWSEKFWGRVEDRVELEVRRRFNKLDIERVEVFEVTNIYDFLFNKTFEAYVVIGNEYVKINIKCTK